MPARHLQRPAGRPGLRWMAGGVGVALAAAAIFAISPANASSATTEAQLSLSGVATSTSVLGGSLIGIHPGDTVDFKASALPTAGLANIPALGSLVEGLLSPLLGQYQVVLHLPSGFPGGARDVTLGGPTTGACAGKPDLPVTFNSAGTYNFSWTVQYALPLLLGCSTSGVSSSDLNLLKGAGVALNATNQWVGQIVAANNPPVGGIGIQLPGLSVAPSLPVVGQLPTIGAPGLNVQLPVSLPTLGGLGNLPIGGASSSSTGGGSTGGSGSGSGSGSGGTTDGLCVPCEVVPAVGLGSGSGSAPGPVEVSQGVNPDSNTSTQLGHGLADTGGSTAPAPVVTSTAAGLSPQLSSKVNLAGNKAPAAQMPVLLAIIAIIALSLVTATYARLYLMRRNTAA